MGKPKIIGYKDEFTGPIGGTLGCADASEVQFVRRRPMYKERPFRAWPAHGGYRVYCKRCKTTTLTGGGQFHQPHDIASRHRCLYNPKEISDAHEA